MRNTVREARAGTAQTTHADLLSCLVNVRVEAEPLIRADGGRECRCVGCSEEVKEGEESEHDGHGEQQGTPRVNVVNDGAQT